ncbi:5-methyltetrahydrofolate--homocysteine methyltransferase [Acetobacterium wieringae]|uniref:5-methyltetrahydrofolate--homocysteine methyltransferase n=1 Tax=Acetobacterium wieringae TaxID=52694 RepID=UPI0026EBFF97|nr:5-methyltetrahydrofolate--homocysteine methyltransferase [Acetobacterium wieringae]
MNDYLDFEIEIDRQKIFNRLDLYEGAAQYDYYLNSYEELLPEFKMLVRPEGYYQLKTNILGKDFHQDFDSPTHVVFCLITLGDAVSKRSTELFCENDSFKGLLLDAMANQLLFDSSERFYGRIRDDVHQKRGYGLTRRYSPGDEGICLSYQKKILDNLDEIMKQKIEITKKYMYKPSKTLGYVYGADQTLECSINDHDCRQCQQKTCSFRKRIN